MADRRRRRRRASQDSEDESGSGSGSGSGSDSGRSGSPTTKSRVKDPPDPPEVTATRVEPKVSAESECESEDGVGEAVLSDYDSADPEENGSHSEGAEEEEEAEQYSDEEAPPAASELKPPAADGPTEEEKEEEKEEEVVDEGEKETEEGGRSKEESKAEEKGNLEGERQSGDGQESTDEPETKGGDKPGQKLDDDEDRKNPAYIPRKGLFFEHDVRGHAQEEERPKGRNRKLWKDEGRWDHDRFREEEQAPKSREELVAIYGYDIRNNGGGSAERPFRQRRPRQSLSPSRDKRWRDGGGERPVRSWQSGGGGLNRGGGAPPSSIHPSSTSSLPLSSVHRNNNNNPSRPPPPRSRPSHHGHMHLPPQYRNSNNNESNAPQMHPRERQGPKAPSDPSGDRGLVIRGPGRGGGGAGRGPSVVIEDITVGGVRDQDPSVVTQATSSQPGGYQSASPRRQQQEQRGEADRSASGLAASSSDSSSLQSTNRGGSPPAERPAMERKSYSLARRTRSRPTDLGSKQPSVEESAAATTGGRNAAAAASSSPSGVGGKSWTGAGDEPSQGGGVTELDQDVARLSLAGQSWSPSPTSYFRSEMRGLPSTMHIPSSPPQFPNMEEMSVGSNRAKRYSSQRQRPTPEPAPPAMHLGVMEGHYYEPSKTRTPTGY
ncbi:protein CASC3 [Anarrhichthys ocellatus]|uniref:protein CASC3 n=1 Tax=Anarrhichthys ocellatus TaxID=433405 RepID=UPI0012ED78C9|nr:protein CASC3 [Anarrhichthys ocellatus]